MPAIHIHSLCLPIQSITSAALAMLAQRPVLKRIRQKIGRIVITGQGRFCLHLRGRVKDAHEKTRQNLKFQLSASAA